MYTSIAISALALAGSALAQNTATSTASVYAAAATAKTESPTSHVSGRAFDRFVTIWLENTDYTKAIADPNLAWLATQGITLSNYFGVTHPSEPNYCASIGGDNFGMVRISRSNSVIQAHRKIGQRQFQLRRQQRLDSHRPP